MFSSTRPHTLFPYHPLLHLPTYQIEFVAYKVHELSIELRDGFSVKRDPGKRGEGGKRGEKMISLLYEGGRE